MLWDFWCIFGGLICEPPTAKFSVIDINFAKNSSRYCIVFILKEREVEKYVEFIQILGKSL